MFERFSGKERSIVSGVKLSSLNPLYVDNCMEFAHRSNMSLKFTHIVKPWLTHKRIYPLENLSPRLVKHAEQKSLEEAKEKMRRVFLELPCNKESFDTEILLGRTGEKLRQSALSSRSSMILCGVQSPPHRLLPKGFSTSVNLMSESSLPVLVIPENKGQCFKKKKLKLLVCDDLTETSSDVLPVSQEIAGGLKNTDIVHLHIHQETKNKLKSWANQVSAMSITQDLEFSFPINEQTIASDIENAIKSKLKDRSKIPLACLKGSYVSYNQLVGFGDVLTELGKTIESEKPDMIAFGRHHFFHKSPVGIGKVPFYAILNFGVPVLVISNIDQVA